MSKEVAVDFEVKSGVSEVGVTLPGQKAVRIKEGKPYTATTPEEVAQLTGVEGVRRVPRKRAAKGDQTKAARAKTKSAPKVKSAPADTSSTTTKEG